MTRNKKITLFIIVTALIITAFGITKLSVKPAGETIQEIHPVIGKIQTVITSTATVQPQNRLEIKPPINGRLDEILVKEGDHVKTGQTLAWMSSTERAALLDAARSSGPETLKYWEEVYKSTPLLSPIDGEVIVSKDYPGQIVTSADAVLVLSDHLIVQAQVDETDIGKIVVEQEATITLDAYPQIKIKGRVNHIYYESQIVNNVTIYQVDILPEEVPEVFRSGMSATVTIVEKARDNVLTIPVGAVKREKSGMYVLISRGPNEKPEERKIETGALDDKNIEVVSGLTTNDTVLLTTKKYKLSASTSRVNPLSPVPRRR